MGEFKTNPPAFNTGCLRYDFQIACARQASPGIVLNVGCNEDPSELRKRFGNRIINCDREGYDEHMQRPNIVDRIFDCLEFPWPFADDSAEMVLFGDILEHFPAAQSIEALKEARRIANTVCVTVPEDTRIDEAAEHAKWKHGVYNLHTTIITREVIEHLFAESGWSSTGSSRACGVSAATGVRTGSTAGARAATDPRRWRSPSPSPATPAH